MVVVNNSLNKALSWGITLGFTSLVDLSGLNRSRFPYAALGFGQVKHQYGIIAGGGWLVGWLMP